MNLNWIDLIGMVAGSATTAAFIPQVIKVFKTHRTGDLSLGLFALSTVGMALWLTYGILLKSFPIILFNSIAGCMSLYVLVMKVKYR